MRFSSSLLFTPLGESRPPPGNGADLLRRTRRASSAGSADGGSVANQARAVYSQDMRTAQELIATHFPKAPDVMLKEDGAGGRPSHTSSERRINAILTGTLACLRCCFLRLTFGPGSVPPGTTKRAATRDIMPAR
jgi:hypothetical protein